MITRTITITVAGPDLPSVEMVAAGVADLNAHITNAETFPLGTTVTVGRPEVAPHVADPDLPAHIITSPFRGAAPGHQPRQKADQ